MAAVKDTGRVCAAAHLMLLRVQMYGAFERREIAVHRTGQFGDQ
jgi:hypothetical protein